MPKSPKQKQKLLLIADYFKDNTDENHTVTTPKLIEYLAANGIKAERKSIYDDIETLREYGMDIVRGPGVKSGYFLGSRDFELAEVKLMVDLVQSSKFITSRKSRELISKLQKLVGKHDASKLQRQVVVADRNKASNENIYYSVDVIHEAIASNARIKYHYFEWDINKQRHLRKNGQFYEVSPWLLTWEDENYYLLGYDGEAGMIKYYRVDKMLNIELTNKKRQGREEFEQIDVAAFSKKTFGMFAGEERTVRLIVDSYLAGAMIDRFGQDVALRKIDDKRVQVRANVAVSPHFFGWITGFGKGIRIEYPEDVALEYKKYITEILEKY